VLSVLIYEQFVRKIHCYSTWAACWKILHVETIWTHLALVGCWKEF